MFCVCSWFDDGACPGSLTVVGDDFHYFFFLFVFVQVFEVGVVVHHDGVDVVDSDLCFNGSVTSFCLAGFEVSYLNCCFGNVVHVFVSCFGVVEGVHFCCC